MILLTAKPSIIWMIILLKIINKFQIDLSDMSADEQVRTFKIEGDNNAIFSLEIKN